MDTYGLYLRGFYAATGLIEASLKKCRDGAYTETYRRERFAAVMGALLR